ncbi:hypothetical protein FXB39_02965 [Nocardioides sp. BGMRC 2183]|nr:hypothetical protein FXB39_02965 [Nocardioides sp. BGMRC 2183]
MLVNRRLALPAAAGALAVSALVFPPGTSAQAAPGAGPADRPAVPATAPVAATGATLPTEGLDILLTNDDGWDALGITAVREALTEAGHHVVTVAPSENNSGVSARVQLGGQVNAVEHEPDLWSVSTSPAGTVHFGMDEFFSDDAPDLVISGTNVGQNTGFDTNYSGTVGAATVASGAYDVPAVAISTAAPWGNDAGGAYDETADLLVEMIDEGLPVLPRGQFLNVNYPQLSSTRAEPLGIRYASNSQASLASIKFAPAAGEDPTLYDIVLGLGSEPHAAGTDTKLLGEGYVTVGVLDADRSVDAVQVPDVTDLVAVLNGDEPAPEPAAVVRKLPGKVAARTGYWVRTANIADGTKVSVVWKSGRKVLARSTATVKSDLFTLRAPKKKGTYTVTVSQGKKKLRAQKVSVR